MARLSRRGFVAAGPLLAAASGVTASAARAAGAAGADGARTAGSPGAAGGRGTGCVPGADTLAADGWRRLAGCRTGVLTNPTGVLRDLTHIVDDMTRAGMRPAAAFGPEHGFRGTAQAGGSEADRTDPRTGVRVYDAYGAGPERLAAMFREARIDTVVYDIAGAGARFYTYTWSMYVAMRAAVLTGARFVVLDRPDPVGGRADGPVLDPAFASGVGLLPVCQQPGMTSGELARMFDAVHLPREHGGRRLTRLDVVPVRGHRRGELFADTGLPWVMPSPNMPTADTALLYPGTGMFEGTLLSEGRGTTRPFELIGAPGIDWRWAETLNGLGLPGVRFRENHTVPAFGTFAQRLCGGVQVHLTDRRSVRAIRTAVAMMVTARRLYPDVFGWRPDHWIDKLTGSDRLRTMIDAGAGTDDVVGGWQDALAAFRRRRAPFLLYS